MAPLWEGRTDFSGHLAFFAMLPQAKCPELHMSPTYRTVRHEAALVKARVGNS